MWKNNAFITPRSKKSRFIKEQETSAILDNMLGQKYCF